MTDSGMPVRASDAEREQVVGRLREATAEGRLTLEEFAERVELAYGARDHDEIARLTADLPSAAAPASAPTRRPRRFTISIFGGIDRKGRWHVARRHWVFSIFGGSDLDFRQATLQEGATVFVVDIFGGTDLYVPDGIDVDFGGFAIFGGVAEHGDDRPPEAGAPVLRIVTVTLFGGTDLWRVPAGATGRRRDLRKAARAAEHDE